MIEITKDIATMPGAVTPALIASAQGTGVSVSGRRTSAGSLAVLYGADVPAFRKDAFSGVRAWSPPV